VERKITISGLHRSQIGIYSAISELGVCVVPRLNHEERSLVDTYVSQSYQVMAVSTFQC